MGRSPCYHSSQITRFPAMERAVASSQLFRFGLFEADPVQNTLTRKGLRVKIQDQPFRALILLLERAGEIISREELRQKLWPEGTYVDFDGSLNVVLKKLRAAIDDDSDNPRFIETIPRRGYRFIAPVSVCGVQAQPVSSVSAEEQSLAAAPATIRPKPEKRRRFYLIYAGSALALVFVVGTAWLVWHRMKSFPKSALPAQAANTPVPMRKSVAVLGFHNVSGKSGDAWLATAFSEMLSTELAAGQKLRLVSGEDVANLRLSSPWPQTDTLDQKTTSRIRSALNSDLVVLGSYAIVGPADRARLRIDVRMQDARTGEILTEIAEIGGSPDLFQVVSRVGDRLRDRLGIPSLEPQEEAGVLAFSPMDREGGRFYALGVSKMREFDWLAAKDLLEQASKADPKFPMVHLMLAVAWGKLGYGQREKDESKKALELSSGLPPVQRLLVEGNYFESLADHERAASTYRALFQLFPDSVDYGLLLANAQKAAGHASQASSTLAQLRALPPPASEDPRIDLADVRATAQNDPARLVFIRRAINNASAQGKKLLYAQARKEECLNLIYSDHPAQGVPSCEEAYNIFMAAGNHLEAADSIRMMGDFEGSQGHFGQAIATYQRALKILEELGEHFKTGAVLNNMAIDYTNQGKIDRAEQLYLKAKFHFEQAGDKTLTALAIGNIADILYLRGDLRGATKLYEQSLQIQSSVEHSDPGYLLYRLADVELAQGHLQDAHRYAQQAVDAIRPNQGAYQYLTGAMTVLGEVLKTEGDLQGARREFEETLAVSEKVGQAELVGESQVELADLAVDEGHVDLAEPLLRPAIAEFEKEKADPDTASAYTVLSRVLLLQGKVEDAHKAIQQAIALTLTSSDPSLKIPAAIQKARVDLAEAGQAGTVTKPANAEQELRSAIATAKRLGFYGLELEARLALGEWDMKINPYHGRTQLGSLAAETRSRGFELLARRAQQAAVSAGTTIAARKVPN
jgi:eukaryotic-like serine/threonine-protein kinase